MDKTTLGVFFSGLSFRGRFAFRDRAKTLSHGIYTALAGKTKEHSTLNVQLSTFKYARNLFAWRIFVES